MKAEQLKNSILQMAVQGKLVAQSDSDEPASVLLTRILKDNKKPTASISKKDIPFDIPNNWVWTRLTNISQHNTGKALNRAKDKKGTLKKYITTSNLFWGYFDLSNLREMLYEETELNKCTAMKGDLLICEGGDAGRSAIWNYDCSICLQNHVHRVRLFGNVLPEYIYNYMYLIVKSGEIARYKKGIGIQGLSTNALGSILIPLPPLAEQQRIVARLQEIEPLLVEYERQEKEHTKLDSEIQEQLKKSILQAAVQGKLVAQNENDEPASELLKRIIKGKKIERISEDEVPFVLPNSWEWIKIDDVAMKLTDGTHYTPTYTSKGVPFLSVKDMSSGKLSFESCRYISAGEHKILYKRCNPQKGDILITKVGTTGVPLIIDTDIEFSIFVSVALLKVSEELNKRFLIYLLKSPLVQEQAGTNTRGVGNKNWVLKSIASTLLAFPPLAEQERIVKRIEELFAIVDDMFAPTPAKKISFPVPTETNDDKFNKWLKKENIAAARTTNNSKVNTKTMRAVFDAMDEYDR